MGYHFIPDIFLRFAYSLTNLNISRHFHDHEEILFLCTVFSRVANLDFLSKLYYFIYLFSFFLRLCQWVVRSSSHFLHSGYPLKLYFQIPCSTKWENRNLSKTVCPPPPSRQGKTFRAPPPFFSKGANLAPPSIRTSSYHINTFDDRNYEVI